MNGSMASLPTSLGVRYGIVRWVKKYVANLRARKLSGSSGKLPVPDLVHPVSSRNKKQRIATNPVSPTQYQNSTGHSVSLTMKPENVPAETGARRLNVA